MKKISLLIMVVITGILLAGCYNDGRGTYYPNAEEMEKNLISKGYDVTVEDADEGLHLDASKKDEFIEFYWMDSPDELDGLKDKLNERHKEYYTMSSTTKSEQFGNLIFCVSKKKVMDDAGIQIVEVKV